jgi:hypothetical protein
MKKYFGSALFSMLKRKKKLIKLFYYNPPGLANFGDKLNEIIIPSLSGSKVIEANAEDAEAIGIGSLLEQFLSVKGEGNSANKREVNVWGAGFIAEPGQHPILGDRAEKKFRRRMTFSAVRGKYTLERLKEMNQDVSKTTIGDPGILIRRLINTGIVAKKYDVGIIAHYADKKDGIIKRLCSKINNSREIDITATPLEVIKSIMECNFILSTAMHGLIAADSLGIPNIHMKISDNLTGGTYKFKDYYSAYDQEYKYLTREESMDLESNKLKHIEKSFDKRNDIIEKTCDNLIKSIPWL